MSADAWQRVVLVQAWVAYFAVHSLLASVGVKRWVAAHRPGWMRGYRLFFNAVAVVLVVPPLVLTFAWRGEPLWAWTGSWAWLANGLALAAVVGFAWSLRFYDSGEFLGMRQWRGRVSSVEDQERLHISPLHRFVRHPWYALGLVIVWTRDMDPAFLITALAITLYFVLGSRLEERKLIQYHGEAYRRYRRRVPGLLPLPWRVLTPAQAVELEGLSRARGVPTHAKPV